LAAEAVAAAAAMMTASTSEATPLALLDLLPAIPTMLLSKYQARPSCVYRVLRSNVAMEVRLPFLDQLLALVLVATAQAVITSLRMSKAELNEKLCLIDHTLPVVLTRITGAILEIMPRMIHRLPWMTIFIDDSSSYER
jgi:hypothetical protein